MCDTTHACVTWLIHVWHNLFKCVTWIFHVCGMTLSRVTWLIHVWHDSFMYDMIHACVTWLIHSWQDFVILVTRLIHICVKTIRIRDKMIHIFDKTIHICDKTIHICDKTIHIREKASDKTHWYLWQHAILCDTTGKQLIARRLAIFALFGDDRPVWLIFVTNMHSYVTRLIHFGHVCLLLPFLQKWQQLFREQTQLIRYF